ncbi:hypothetical protein [Azospirillum argentinense]
MLPDSKHTRRAAGSILPSGVTRKVAVRKPGRRVDSRRTGSRVGKGSASWGTDFGRRRRSFISWRPAC